MLGSPTVAIVDPLSTGAYLAGEFAKRGWTSIAALSTEVIPPAYAKGFREQDFERVIRYRGDVDDMVADLSRAGVSVVVAGAEHGVELADLLAERLGLPGNGVALSRARRDKYAMVGQLRRQGIPTAESIVTDDVADIVSWADAGQIWPIVVKPLASAGSDGVTFCDDPAQARAAFSLVYGHRNQLGGHNHLVMAQQRLFGQQYFVNTVSRDGRHYVSEIWQDVRLPVGASGQVYDREELLAPEGEVQRALVAYALPVLDALGIVHGPAHTEMMLTSAGPVLIETGARMQGAVLPDGVVAATGQSHVTLTVDCYADPERFDALPGTPYPLHRQLRVVSLIAPFDGFLNPDGPTAELHALPTLVGAARDISPGTPVRRTVDLFSAPGHLYLVGGAAEIDRDYARIRELERVDLYVPALAEPRLTESLG